MAETEKKGGRQEKGTIREMRKGGNRVHRRKIGRKQRLNRR